MDDLPGLLSGEFGIRPQGKAAPMAASRGGGSSGKSSFPSMASGNVRSNREASMLGDPMQMDGGFGNFGNRQSSMGHRGGGGGGGGGGGLGDLDGIFGGGGASSVNTRTTSFGLESVFDGFKDPLGATKPVSTAAQSGPIFDKPVYDDDMFDGIPGLKTSSSTGKFDDVFASFSSNHQRTPIEDNDLLGDLSGKRSSVLDGKHSPVVTEQANSGFDDLIPGFGGSSPPQKSDYLDAKHQRSSSQSNYRTKNTVPNDPFVDLDSKPVPTYSSSSSFTNPLDDINVPSGKANSDTSNGLFDDINNFSGLNNSMPHFSSDISDIKKEKNTLKSGEKTNHRHPTSVKESAKKSSVDSSSDTIRNKGLSKSYREPEKTQFDIPAAPLDSGSSSSSGRFGAPSADSNFEQSESNSKEHEDIWLTVSEVPLFTQLTSAPPPSRSPPPFTKGQNPFAYGSKGVSANPNAKSRVNGVSSIDELEEFAMGKPQSYADEHAEVISSDEDIETNSAAAAAATTAAVGRAEAKIKQARESRERWESRNGGSSEFSTQVKKEKAATDLHNQESKEYFDSIDTEQEQKEREEKEKERRRVEKERAAVDKALNEVRGRAAAEARDRVARQKSERAAVEKANAEARERAARASVQKATAEARERAARASVQKATAEARERAAAEMRERAEAEARERAAEARERAIAETKEKEAREAREAREKAAREKAAVQRATQDARLRAERAAVEKATREARERAAASAREKQQKNETDLDSVFGMNSRATSEPKQRAATQDFSFDAQTNKKRDPFGAKTASSVSSSSGIRKASSANILDDLSSVFGAPSTSGDFQEIDGESEERRKARFERDQRTRERAKKALDEKNQRDMEVQREQAERERIVDRLEIEIKRWAAGKEGNLRALLSTLQYVLWPECGWQAVSLTDLITAASVKKAYRKATLHIHPDKVQQKGANLEQKMIAEKVFDLLKEAWNKFNSEELF